jgi:hypothetical protein
MTNKKVSKKMITIPANSLPEGWPEMIKEGWTIKQTSSVCGGGSFVWLKSSPSGTKVK